MDLKLQKDECPSGRYWMFRQGRWWEIKVLSNGTIFIKLIQEVGATFENYYFNKLKSYLLKFIGNSTLL
jgi:hypothetical protein